MIYNNQGGNIGFSCSKISQTKKKLFTPIKLSIPLLSEIKNYREKSLPNSPRNETKNIEIQNSKANFILPKKNSNSEGNSPIKKTKKKNKNMFLKRNE
jgi:hypothetical protein